MDHSSSYGSLGASTLVHTPSPLERRVRSSASVPDLASHGSNQDSYYYANKSSTTSALKSSGSSTPAGTTPRNVRFTTDVSSVPSRPSFPTTYSSSGTSPHSSPFSSAPLTRVLSNGGTPTKPAATSTSPPRLPIARPSPTRDHSMTTSSTHSTPARSFSSGWNTTPIKSIVPSTASVSKAVHGVTAAASAASASASLSAKAIVPTERKSLPPMTRQEVARRLRTNAVLLVLWWISSRTQVYSYTSDHLVHFVPSLSGTLNLLEKALFVLLCYNIADSMRSLNNFSSLPSPPTWAAASSSLSPVKASPSLRRVGATPILRPPVHSSPKTRPTSLAQGSPGSMSGSPTPTFRASAMSSPQPPSPQTPASISRPTIASSTLRNSFVGNALINTSPHASPLSGKGVGGGDSDELVNLKSSFSAYRARHEPLSPPKVSVNSKEAIDRMFEM